MAISFQSGQKIEGNKGLQDGYQCKTCQVFGNRRTRPLFLLEMIDDSAAEEQADNNKANQQIPVQQGSGI
jgi:hypothetical protein